MICKVSKTNLPANESRLAIISKYSSGITDNEVERKMETMVLKPWRLTMFF